MIPVNKGYGSVLRRFGINPKKRLGQHFMTDANLLKDIARVMVPDPSSVVMEIGAGPGTLTRELAELANHVYAVELDESFGAVREHMLEGLHNVSWIWGDALKQDLSGHYLRGLYPDSSLVLCGNLPYYITSEVLYSSLIDRPLWKRMAFVVQEEVAKRMAAPEGTRGFSRISLWCQYRAKVNIAGGVPRHVFFPRPDVESSLITLDVRESFPLDEKEERCLAALSKRVFSTRRKTILNALGPLADKSQLSQILTGHGLDVMKRPEALTLKEFIVLAQALLPVFEDQGLL